jgi:hypothetical protein
MRISLAIATVCTVLLSISGHAQTLYLTPQRAASQCKGPVVWLNLDTRVASVPGQRDYGNTPNGAYVCRYALNKPPPRPVASGH